MMTSATASKDDRMARNPLSGLVRKISPTTNGQSKERQIPPTHMAFDHVEREADRLNTSGSCAIHI
ncbi:hypothetical protein HMPREF1317_1464 [Schaalia georgiae F0490]|uniref:Uncharacterized protein n=1 Tax=Schaalia georgiae F0490 TaxID=1125717 RepID=J0N1A5_9ACTO|nr:hypothetical protein HMPREF1317_1464 [Schaalia georgiae F0490]